MEKIKNLSIRKSLILYIAASLIISFFTGALIARGAERVQTQVWWNYVDEDAYFEALNQEGTAYVTDIPRPSRADMTRMDWRISENCDFLQTYGILMVSVFGMITAVILFYKNKIKIPLAELQAASARVAQNELDFHIDYVNQDELGILCRQFEHMRNELEKNNRTMWRMIEEEKALRAAIAHDIRTPLTILRGYQEMLLEFQPDNLGEEKTQQMLEESIHQIERINNFLETMRRISSLEMREIKYQNIDAESLRSEVEKIVQVLSRGTDKRTVLSLTGGEHTVAIDKELVLEVTENLVSNALRYAKQEVKVILSLEKGEVAVTVQDDGCGFSVSEEQATTAFYHSNPQEDGKHMGMGMYLSRLYCEKHGGKLFVENQESGGARVRAMFKVRN